MTINLPRPGERVGAVCGPGEFPKDDAGVVMCITTDRWGTHAKVLMDDGRTETCHGLTNRGIGWYRLEAKRTITYSQAAQALKDIEDVLDGGNVWLEPEDVKRACRIVTALANALYSNTFQTDKNETRAFFERVEQLETAASYALDEWDCDLIAYTRECDRRAAMVRDYGVFAL